MIECVICKQQIESDSFFCDQCGTELMRCPKCYEFGGGLYCEIDGEELVAAKALAIEPLVNEPSTPEPVVEEIPLVLINQNVGLEIVVKPGDILGRTTGPHADKLGRFGYISGQHLRVTLDPAKGWQIEDLNSSNKTKLSAVNGAWKDVQPCQPFVTYLLAGLNYVLIADIEFRIHIEAKKMQNSNATQRL